MPYIVAWTAEHGPSVQDLVDHFDVYDELAAAETLVEKLREREDVYCWAVTKILSASEPHWTEVQDPRTEKILDEAFAAVFERRENNGN